MKQVFEIDDNTGETHWIAAASEGDARKIWFELFGKHEADTEIYGIDALPPDKDLTIAEAGDGGETLTKKASEWALVDGNGLVGTTAF